jgi:D-serine deaminase-like pyridoxal phosphate-dependent protein
MNENIQSWDRWRALIASSERLPASLVDLDAFDRNVQRVATIAGKKPVRVATKSIRVPDLIRRALAYGAPFKGLMCYSAEELAFLAREGFDDLLLAYPVTRAAGVDALFEAHEKHAKKVAVVVDSVIQVKTLAHRFHDCERPLNVLVDIDVSSRWFGSHIGALRSPLRTNAEILVVTNEISKHSCLRLQGAMAYESQVAGLGDRNPFKKWLNPVAWLVRKLAARGVAKRRRQIAALFKLHSLNLEIFNGGGTGSSNIAARESPLTEITAGSAFYCPHLFDYFSNVSFEPASFFALEVARAPQEGIATCLGGGYIASGQAGPDRLPIPWIPRGSKLVPVEGCGEVQTPVVVPSDARVRTGDPIFFRHAKAGEMMERFSEVVLVSGEKISARVKTYRGFGLNSF